MRPRRTALALGLLGFALVLLAPIIVAGNRPQGVEIVDLRTQTQRPGGDNPAGDPMSPIPASPAPVEDLPADSRDVDDVVEGDGKDRDEGGFVAPDDRDHAR